MSGVNTHAKQGLGERLPRLVSGPVSLPISKSLALRGLLVASGLRRSCRMISASASGWGKLGGDLLSGVECARALGAEVVVSGDLMEISWGLERADGDLRVGESGFVARVAPSCAALSRSGRWTIHGEGTLLTRSSLPLWECLEAAGVTVGRSDSWATSVSRPGALGDLTLRDPISSQEVSALIIGLASAGGGALSVSGPIPSRPYLAMTKDVLAIFGYEVSESETALRVHGDAVDPSEAMLVEVDASAAAVALAAGCLAGVRVEVPRPSLNSSQGDWRIVDHLRDFGCVIDQMDSHLVSGGPPLNGVDIDLAGEPDLAPVLAIVAAAAALRGAGSSILRGLETLDRKESARGRVLSSGLQAAGFQCEWSGTSLKICGSSALSKQISLDASGDHRMAFAFALLGLICPNIWVREGGCIEKSWPDFWSAMGG